LPGKNNFPRSLSLKSRVEITGLLNEGQRFTGNCFTLIWRPEARFAWCVLVSKRLGKATDRVRIKRKFREAIRLSRQEMKATGIIAILPKSGCLKLSFETIKSDVNRLVTELR
jgi:ribonuclease P protein component